MSYFPCDIPFMSEDEKKKNGIKCNSDVDKDINVPSTDTISRQATITEFKNYERDSTAPIDYVKIVEQMPPAQPERTCVNCGRTANNGGWYADGGTRCPIEEHYALPKDGYCHLWEKRNVTDDDYPERRTDDCKDNV